MPAKKIAIGVTLFILFIIILQNLTVVDVKFLFWKLGINLLLVILLPFLVGAVMGWFFRSLYAKPARENNKESLDKSQAVT
jgi:uncharacterized integral membrane protein